MDLGGLGAKPPYQSMRRPGFDGSRQSLGGLHRNDVSRTFIRPGAFTVSIQAKHTNPFEPTTRYLGLSIRRLRLGLL